MGTKRHRRIRTDPVPGTDPTPQAPVPGRAIDAELAAEDRLGAWGDGVREGRDSVPGAGTSSNDARLIGDKPPHYG